MNENDGLIQAVMECNAARMQNALSLGVLGSLMDKLPPLFSRMSSMLVASSNTVGRANSNVICPSPVQAYEANMVQTRANASATKTGKQTAPT